MNRLNLPVDATSCLSESISLPALKTGYTWLRFVLTFSLTVGTAVADSFAEQAQISYDLLKAFTLNYRRHKGSRCFASKIDESNL
jgi:hypothetical protein